MTRCPSRYSGCKCIEIATKCTFGPDDIGDVVTDVVVPPGRADGCAPEFCICTSHDNYHKEKASRLEMAAQMKKGIEEPEEEEEEGDVAEEKNDVVDTSNDEDFENDSDDNSNVSGSATDTEGGVGSEKDDQSSVMFLAMIFISVAVILISVLCILYVIYLFKKRVDKKGKEDQRARENVYKVEEGDDGGKVEIDLEPRNDICPRPPSEYCPRPPSEYSANAERPSMQPKESLNP